MKLRPAMLVLALAASSFAWGEALDPPERVARLSYVEGQVAFQGAQETVRSDLPDRPLMPGDRLFTERGGRAELALGTAAVRLDERTDLTIVGLDATTVWVELNTGTASVVLHELLEGEMFQIVTPNTAISLQGPGEYRVEVSADGATALTVRGGAADVDTADGPVRVADGQRVRLEGRDAFANLSTLPPEDAFDAWVRAREQVLADSESRYALDEGDDYETLDRYGEWYDEPRYGRVWMPAYAYGGYDPFRYGHWERIGFHGRTWVDRSPWSSFTFRNGRWAFLHHLNRWCWVPRQRRHDRHVAQDTRPFGHPRDEVRSLDDGEDVLRRVLWRSDPKDERRPVATTAASPRRIDADRQPVFRRDVESVKQTRSGTFVPSTNRDRSPPQRSAPAPQGGTATMRPSRTTESRREIGSRPAAPTSRAFGRPQPP